MTNTTLGSEINRALLALLMKAEGPAVDPSRDIISTGKTTSSPPPNYHSEYEAWRERFVRLLMALHRELGSEPRQPRTTTKDLLEVIRDYEGRDKVYVAFVEGCSVELVEKARTIIGVKPSDGTRRERPLTSRTMPGQNLSDLPPTDAIVIVDGEVRPESESS